MNVISYSVSVLIIATISVVSQAADQDEAIAYLDSNAAQYQDLAMTIWDHAELGYQENRSSTLLQETLAAEGFAIEAGVAGIPTAFVASYGSGEPVIGLLAEFDALPGISQSSEPLRQPVEGKSSGHACGHHLFGAGSITAMGTGTTVAAEVIHGNHSVLPNEALATVMHRNLSTVGGVRYNKAEREYASKITSTLDLTEDLQGLEEQIAPLKFFQLMGSTDVGDVSWRVPTAEMRAATWVPGTSPHTWQAIAAGGTSIGGKGMMVAAKTMTLTAIDLFEQPALLAAAREEFEQRLGPDFHYEALLGDRDPPLDYRKGVE